MSDTMKAFHGPHQSQPILVRGAALNRARAAMIMVHGRGARAEDILSLVDHFAQPEFTYLAPQAANQTWYPNRFLAPLESNEPWLSSALALLNEAFFQVVLGGIAYEHTMLLGFSQGACLAMEFTARNARRYGGVAGLSGALIGPEGTPRAYPPLLAGTPVFLGCSDVDPHVPKERVDDSASVLRRLGGNVTERLYPDLDHSINQDEIDFIRGMMEALVQRA